VPPNLTFAILGGTPTNVLGQDNPCREQSGIDRSARRSAAGRDRLDTARPRTRPDARAAQRFGALSRSPETRATPRELAGSDTASLTSLTTDRLCVRGHGKVPAGGHV